MINIERTIISQYANSATIVTLIQNMDECIDPRADFDTFYNYVWNVETAQGFGLDIWGRIVGVSRLLNVPGSTPNPGGYSFTPGTYELSDSQYRTVLLVKALANISDSTANSLNTLFSNLFATRGRCYALDTGSMTMRLVFEFYLEPFEYVIINTIAPRPAGVLLNILQVDPAQTFGFQEAIQFQPFNQGTFYQP